MKYANELIFHLLISFTFFFTSCNGQVKTNLQSKTLPFSTSQAKLKKTQGTSEYEEVRCGLQDRFGNLWFGTTGEGVYRYDGKVFTQFTKKSGLSSNTIWSILEDKNGIIWLGTDEGICVYDGKTFSHIPISLPNTNFFNPLTSPVNAQLGKNAVWSIMQDKSGRLWFGTTGGVYCYNEKTFTRFLDNNNVINIDGLNLKMVCCIMEGKNGDIWFTSGMPPGGEGLCHYDGKCVTHLKAISDGWIRTVIENKDGSLYLATRHFGVCCYDGKNVTNITNSAGIDNRDVTSIVKDKAGNIWITTESGSGGLGEDGGVWRYDGKSFKKFTTKDGLIHNGVWLALEDKVGNLWFGTRNVGLCRYDGKVFTSFSE